MHKRSEHLHQRSATPVETVQTVVGALGLVLEDAQE